jgi:Iodothyronine deiodinase
MIGPSNPPSLEQDPRTEPRFLTPAKGKQERACAGLAMHYHTWCEIYFRTMYGFRYALIALFSCSIGLSTQAQKAWNPSCYNTDSGLVFHNDLDFYLNNYTQKEIKVMRKQVNIFKMNFDKLMRRTIADIRAYSEGFLSTGRACDLTLPDTAGGRYTLHENQGKVRAFMFVSVTCPPALAQLERWDAMRALWPKDEVDLFLIYGEELHPGERHFKNYPRPQSETEKMDLARSLARRTDLPVYVDGLNNAVLESYGRVPNAAYVVDREGHLVFRGTWADSRKVETVVGTLQQWYAAGKPSGEGWME